MIELLEWGAKYLFSGRMPHWMCIGNGWLVLVLTLAHLHIGVGYYRFRGINQLIYKNKLAADYFKTARMDKGFSNVFFWCGTKSLLLVFTMFFDNYIFLTVATFINAYWIETTIHEFAKQIPRIQNDLVRNKRILNTINSAEEFGFWSWDIHTNDVVWSDGMYRIYDKPLDWKIDLEELDRLVYEEDKESYAANRLKAINAPSEHKYQYRISTEKGRKKVLLSWTYPVFKDQELASMYGYVLNVTNTNQKDKDKSLKIKELELKIVSLETQVEMKKYRS